MDYQSQFRLFGPVEYWSAGARVDLGPLKQRTVLAALLADTGRVVTQETLIDRVWDDAPPTEVRNVLYTYITRLRRILRTAGTGSPKAPADHGGVRLLRRSGGYLLEAVPEVVDLHRVKTLVAQAKTPGLQDAERSDLLRAALASTEGVPLADIPCAWAARARERMIRLRVGALIGYSAVETRLGRPGTAVDALHHALADQPLAEELVSALMAALYQAGRTAEALDVFGRARSTILAELGVEPSAELHRLHQGILRGSLPRVGQDPVETAAFIPLQQKRAEREQPAPHMLPAQVAHYAGRPEEETAIIAALTGSDRRSAAIAAVIGASGLGKSALALHVAHMLRDEFPDGQLYAELHGATGPEATASILVRFLRALGRHPDGLPQTVEELAELYRGILAGRRILVVLDGVADEEQVVPLLPGSADCAILLTSRDPLAGIRCTRVAVDVLREAEAVGLLAAITGEDRVRAEPQAARTLTELCGRFPIAVRIAGARLLTRPHWPIAQLVARLSDERGRLDELVHGRMAVRDALDHGYRALDQPARSLFRHLGRLDADDFDPRLASRLLGVDQNTADDALDELLAARMVDFAGCDDHGKRRYRLGSLARLYARDRADAEGTDHEAHRIEFYRRRVELPGVRHVS